VEEAFAKPNPLDKTINAPLVKADFFIKLRRVISFASIVGIEFMTNIICFQNAIVLLTRSAEAGKDILVDAGCGYILKMV